MIPKFSKVKVNFRQKKINRKLKQLEKALYKMCHRKKKTPSNIAEKVNTKPRSEGSKNREGTATLNM